MDSNRCIFLISSLDKSWVRTEKQTILKRLKSVLSQIQPLPEDELSQNELRKCAGIIAKFGLDFSEVYGIVLNTVN